MPDKHRILRQEIHLYLEDETEAVAIQERVSEYFYSYLLAEIEKVFDRLTPRTQVWKIDAIEIDLGSLTEEDLLGKKSLEILGKLLTEKLIQWQQENGTRPANVVLLEQDALSHWLYFLQKGIYAWQQSYSRQHIKPKVLEALATDPSAVDHFLTLIRKDTLALNRLILQHPFIFLQNLVKAVLGKDLRAWENFFTESQELKNQLQKQPQLKTKEFSDRVQQWTYFGWQFIWKQIAEYKSLPNPQEFQIKLAGLIDSSGKERATSLIRFIRSRSDSFPFFEEAIENRSMEILGHKLSHKRESLQPNLSKSVDQEDIGEPLGNNSKKGRNDKGSSTPSIDQDRGGIPPSSSPKEEQIVSDSIPDQRDFPPESKIDSPIYDQRETEALDPLAHIPPGPHVTETDSEKWVRGQENRIETQKESLPSETHSSHRVEEGASAPGAGNSLDFYGELRDQIPKDLHVLEEELFLQQAGLVLAHPYLLPLFQKLDWIQHKRFLSSLHQAKAIHLLYFLATKEQTPGEEELALPKILCGWPLKMPLEREVFLEEKTLKEGQVLLEAILENWGALGKSSPMALREGFFQREGKLSPSSLGWTLTVEQHSIDILLDHLPWGIGMIKLPWMKKILQVQWR